ncbi:hypothetical protein [Methanothermobacter sp. K4]|uniref:hypothetical protein n=1 Tax=Methanothermobacter sp. K4 TaxID=2913262 RepID=UPI001EDC68DA|nr:hypothetical protein [Methanothermobacter sp. K4]MCG2829352.1 hypothetical protein [Methanothermobacter sp. K4]
MLFIVGAIYKSFGFSVSENEYIHVSDRERRVIKIYGGLVWVGFDIGLEAVSIPI